MKNLQTAVVKGFMPLLVGIFTLFSVTAFGQSKTQTIKGEVVDLSCYIDHGAKGAGHQMCAKMCIEKGLPAGLLTSNGNLYLLIENHKKSEAYAKLSNFAAKDAAITGHVSEKNGMKALTVEEINGKQ